MATGTLFAPNHLFAYYAWIARIGAPVFLLYQLIIFIDFGYTLLTRAGFTVLRQGVAQAQVADGAVVGIVTATTALRYKELAEQLEKMADSFRAYPVKAPAFGAGSPI